MVEFGDDYWSQGKPKPQFDRKKHMEEDFRPYGSASKTRSYLKQYDEAAKRAEKNLSELKKLGVDPLSRARSYLKNPPDTKTLQRYESHMFITRSES